MAETSKKINIIRHLAFEDMGHFADVLAARGYQLNYLEASVDDLTVIEAGSDELLVILGGPISANDSAEYPFLDTELALLEKRLALDKPTLGICLGAQLMAKALGARVYAGEVKEIGWAPVTLTEAGTASSLRHLAEADTHVLHWHGETFDLPTGTTLLASTDHYPNQAFSIGRRCLALQFHPEVTAEGLEAWYIGHTGEIHEQGILVKQLRADSASHAQKCLQQAEHFFSDWLDQVIAVKASETV